MNFFKIPEGVHNNAVILYLDTDKYGFKSFDEVPRNKTAYDKIQENVKLKGWKWDNIDEERINYDIEIFISIFKNYTDDQEISKEIII